MPCIVQSIELRKDFALGKSVVHALRGLSLEVEEGEYLAIFGPSGSGKTTLLSLLGGLDVPTAGRVILKGVDITSLNESKLAEIRNAEIGFVFQLFNLIPTLTALENVELPILFAAQSKFNSIKRAKELLKLVGLADRLHHRPSELSGGEQQRVAIARALANAPSLILADEPTGNLDSATGGEILKLLRRLCDEQGQTVVIVTHDPRITTYAERIVFLQDGRITDEIRMEHPYDTEAILQKLMQLEPQVV